MPIPSELTVEEQAYLDKGGEGELAPETHVDESIKPETERGQATGPESKPEDVTAPQVPEPKKASGKTVPIEALHEARSENKEFRDQLRAEAEKRAKMEERLQTFISRLQQDEVPKIPDFEQDPINHLRMKMEMLERENQQLKSGIDKTAGQLAFDQDTTNKITRAQALAAQFMKATPDYLDAYNHVRTVEANKMRRYGANEDQIASELRNAEINLISHALGQNKNPAELIYELAKDYGYTAKKTAVTNGKAEAQPTIEQLEKGLAAAKTVASGTPTNELTLEALAQMSDEEFNGAIEKNWNKIARMMGSTRH